MSRKRQKKKDNCIDWGTLPMFEPYDVRYNKASNGPSDKYIGISIWRSIKHKRVGVWCSKRSTANYQEFTKPMRLSKTRQEVGRLHFSIGDMQDVIIVHECIHAANHGERIIGEVLNYETEERMCYRTERIFGAVQQFRDDILKK